MQTGRYRLEEVIGVGSFATVYRAADDLLEDTVVVKILAENHSLNPEIRERFIAEGRSLRRVESPHVVTVHDIGESERQQPYLVLEHADRGTLAERLSRLRSEGWRPSREDLLALVRPLAAAVGAVHRARLVHRDLSPGNLLLASAPPEGPDAGGAGSQRPGPAQPGEAGSAPMLLPAGERLLLADLGMCKDLAMNSGLTVSGGTAGFRPPEQNGPGTVDFRADIWAMSAVLRWVAEGAGLERQMHRRLHRVLSRGMQTDPGRRQTDTSTWLSEVEEALALPEPAPSQGAEPSHSSPEQAHGSLPAWPRQSLRRRVLTSGVVFVLVLALGVLGGFLLRGPGEEPLSSYEEVSLGIDGPAEITVGETASFTAEVEGAESWVWVLPTGTHVADEQEAVLIPTRAGTAEVILRAQAPGGPELETRHTVQVVE